MSAAIDLSKEISRQLQAELLQQQVEELDVAYIMFMLAAYA